MPTCGQCGSPDLRRSHNLGRLQRLVRRSTPWDRYSCRTCGHRGWARGPFTAPGAGRSRAAPARDDTPAGRKPEQRDHRQRRKLRTRAVVLTGLSLLLGVLAALSMQRCGLPGAPP